MPRRHADPVTHVPGESPTSPWRIGRGRTATRQPHPGRIGRRRTATRQPHPGRIGRRRTATRQPHPGRIGRRRTARRQPHPGRIGRGRTARRQPHPGRIGRGRTARRQPHPGRIGRRRTARRQPQRSDLPTCHGGNGQSVVGGRGTHWGRAPDSPWRKVRLTVAERPTHRGGVRATPEGRPAMPTPTGRPARTAVSTHRPSWPWRAARGSTESRCPSRTRDTMGPTSTYLEIPWPGGPPRRGRNGPFPSQRPAHEARGVAGQGLRRVRCRFAGSVDPARCMRGLRSGPG